MKDAVERLVNRNGEEIKLTVFEKTGIDYDTGKPIFAGNTFSVKAAILAVTSSDIIPGLVEQGDIKIILYVNVMVKEGDTATVGGIEFSVVNTEEVRLHGKVIKKTLYARKK